jgi:hypothetical protein
MIGSSRTRPATPALRLEMLARDERPTSGRRVPHCAVSHLAAVRTVGQRGDAGSKSSIGFRSGSAEPVFPQELSELAASSHPTCMLQHGLATDRSTDRHGPSRADRARRLRAGCQRVLGQYAGARPVPEIRRIERSASKSQQILPVAFLAAPFYGRTAPATALARTE